MYKYFFHFELLASNTIKNETGKKFTSLLEINLVNYSSAFVTHKKHLDHTGTLANVEKNCTKLSGFIVDIQLDFFYTGK